jgi:mersacidin/lichenicidin family type 2 lantibiotic
MDREQIIKAWKDEEYRESLGEGERALLPVHPSGLIELTDAQLGAAGGEQKTAELWTYGCCWYTYRIDCSNTYYAMTLGCCAIAPVG